MEPVPLPSDIWRLAENLLLRRRPERAAMPDRMISRD